MVFNKNMATANNKTIHELWEEITRGFLNNRTEENPSPTLTLRPRNQTLQQTPNLILQDFLSGPFGRENSQPANLSPHVISSTPPVLTLNSTPAALGFDFFNSYDTIAGHASHYQTQNGPGVHCLTGNSPCFLIGSAGGASSSHGRKRVQANGVNYRELKRLIKNRESAARSRARQQAYHADLEDEVLSLHQENGRLRVIHKELEKALAVAPEPAKRNQLSRAHSV